MAATVATYKSMFARKGQSLRNTSAGLSPLVDRPGTNSGKPHTTQVEGVQGITDQSRRAGDHDPLVEETDRIVLQHDAMVRPIFPQSHQFGAALGQSEKKSQEQGHHQQPG